MARVVAIIMLLVALLPNPYGYYILLRWVICGICAYHLFEAVRMRNQPWTWVFGVGAAIYNPIFPLHLQRSVWSVVKIASAVLLIASFSAMRGKRRADEQGER
jgi:hypothetical protein